MWILDKIAAFRAYRRYHRRQLYARLIAFGYATVAVLGLTALAVYVKDGWIGWAIVGAIILILGIVTSLMYIEDNW